MAGDVNALTLHDWAVQSNDPLVHKVTKSIYEGGNLLQDIPLMTEQSMLVNGVRWVGGLPVPTWADLNEGPVSVTATPERYQEQAFLVRNNIDTDIKLVQDKNQIGDIRGGRVDAYLEGFKFDFNNKFFNAVQTGATGNAKCFAGLRTRIDNPNTYKVNSEMKINAGGVDLSPTGITAKSANAFIELVDQALSYTGVDDGTGIVIYMNDTLKRRFATALRTAGPGAGFTIDKDAYDRTVEKYRNAVIRDPGRQAPTQNGTQTARIISPQESAAGADTTDGSGTFTSFYVVRFGQDAFCGWQFEALKPRDLGLINDGVTYRTVFDYAVGLWMVHTRSIGRVYNIKIA